MTSPSIAQKMLQQEVLVLPENLATEVLDFIQFLKARRAEEAFLWQQVEGTRIYRQEHPGDVQTVTADEWLAETTDASTTQ